MQLLLEVLPYISIAISIIVLVRAGMWHKDDDIKDYTIKITRIETKVDNIERKLDKVEEKCSKNCRPD